MPIELDILRGIRNLAAAIGTSAILLFISTVIINIITMFPKRVNPDKRKTRPWEPTPAVRIDELPEAGQEIINQSRPKRVKRHETNEGFVLDYNRDRQTAQRYRGKGKAFTGEGEIGRRQLEPLSRLRPTPLSLWSDKSKPPQHPPPGGPSGGPSGPPGPGAGGGGGGIAPAPPPQSAPPVTPGITSSGSTKPDSGGLSQPWISPSIDFWIPWKKGNIEWAKALARERQRDVGISADELLNSLEVLRLPIFFDKFHRDFMTHPGYKDCLSGATGHPYWFFQNMRREYYGEKSLPYQKPSEEEFSRARMERTTREGQKAIIQRALVAMKRAQEHAQGVNPSTSSTSSPVPPKTTTSTSTTGPSNFETWFAALKAQAKPPPVGSTSGTTTTGFPVQDEQEVEDYIKNMATGLITGLSSQVDPKTTTAPVAINPLATAPRPPQTSKPAVSAPAIPATTAPVVINPLATAPRPPQTSKPAVPAPGIPATTAPVAINPFTTAPRPPQTSKPAVPAPGTPATSGGGLSGRMQDKIGGLIRRRIDPYTDATTIAEVQMVFGPPNNLVVLPPTIKQNIPFHYVSDLHLEQTSYENFDFKPRAPYLILAGDIGNTNAQSETHYRKFLARMCAKPELRRVFLVAGNRDFWPANSCTVEGTIKMLRGFTRHPDTLGKLVFLENDRYVIQGKEGKVVILGCTLWTERLRGGGREPRDQTNKQRTERHFASCEWIRQETKKIRDDPKEVETRILIITHMPPSKSGTSPPEQTAKQLRDFNSGASHGSDVIDGCKGHGYDHSSIETTMPLLDWRDVWIWGHTHWNEPHHGKRRHGGMRFESNQRGNAKGIPLGYHPKPPGAFKPEKIILV